MIKRTIDISDGPTFLQIENDQLVLTREKRELARIPCEDVGVLLIDNRATTYTHSAMTRLLSYGAVVVFCDEKHLPCGILLPVADNELLAERLRTQVAAKVPLKKQLWRQIIIHKIKGQAENLPPDHVVRRRLLQLSTEVKSGDTSNCEGHAGRFYWPALMGESFRRDPDGIPPNGLLNYGYMVLRAACARAIVAGGLNPALGLHHSNRSNPFCLADDLIEVFRPRVDAVVLRIMKEGGGFIDKPTKEKLLFLLSETITVAGQSGPMMVCLHRVVSSLVRCYAGEQKALDLPEFAHATKIAQTQPDLTEDEA
jgi:CRISPR-associated protein Cas1